MTEITESSLTAIGFKGPYPHGEFYLFDEKYGRKVIRDGKEENWCVIMAVEPPIIDFKTKIETGWTANFNSERGLWRSDQSFFCSGWIEIKSIEQLNELIIKSKELSI